MLHVIKVEGGVKLNYYIVLIVRIFFHIARVRVVGPAPREHTGCMHEYGVSRLLSPHPKIKVQLHKRE